MINVLQAQDMKNWDLSGYVSNMESAMFSDINNPWISDNLIHNRLNFNWYPSNWLSVNLGVRNRLMWGDSFSAFTNYSSNIAADKGYFNLNSNLFSGSSYLLNSSVDRALVEINTGKWNVKVGRQRINWGQNFVWNPNDIFNSYSFFDFDYIERSGADAVRIQYYPSMSSTAEIAIKTDHENNITAAGLYRFNIWNYDFQFLGGMLNSTDYVAGMGFSGNIKDAGFNGELSYFKPIENEDNGNEMLVASLGTNYTFRNSLMLRIEALYSQETKGFDSSFLNYFSEELSAKTLSLSEYTIMADASYTFTPLLSGSLSSMYYFDMEGYYAGLNLEYSLSNNLSLSAIAQYYNIEINEETMNMTLLFLRIKGSF